MAHIFAFTHVNETGGILQHRVLIVDDSPAFRKALIEQIASLDANIIEASNGLEGFNVACSQKIDLIISDIDMPEMNGIALCRKIRSDERTEAIPIIIQSAFDSELDIEQGFKAGASAYFSKSDANGRLIDTIDSILSKQQLNRSRLVLVVDDSEVIRSLIKNGLRSQGFQVQTAENGQEALSRIAEQAPHLILSDIDMPVMNGFTFCRAIKSDKQLSAIPFVVMSANEDKSRMQRMISLGAEAYLYKPFNVDELVVLIEKLLSDHYILLLNKAEKLATEQALALASITSLVTALEARDSYTRGHSEDVALIVSEMGRLLGMKPEAIERLNFGGKLHDIGKIGVKDSILLKPGKLTNEEFAQIKQHPVIGATILNPIESLKDVVEMVLNHHERFDGKGYPNGLKGGSIPPWARMVAVADTYNALTSNRSYRKAMSKGKALQIIEDVKGTQLCPECVELFLHNAETVID